MKYKNQQAIERLRDEFGTREFINAPRKELEQFLDEQLTKKGEKVIEKIITFIEKKAANVNNKERFRFGTEVIDYVVKFKTQPKK